MSINASFIGNIGQNAKINQAPTGSFTNFSVAVNDPFQKEKTEWVDCVVFGERGTKLAPHLVSGVKVYVTGKLNLETFVRKSGETGTKLKLWVGDLEFASAAKPKEDAPEPSVVAEVPHTYMQDIPF
jgi:single-strand DNA-binding protein